MSTHKTGLIFRVPGDRLSMPPDTPAGYVPTDRAVTTTVEDDDEAHTVRLTTHRVPR